MSSMEETDKEFSWKVFLERISDKITAPGINKRRSLIEMGLLPALKAHALEDREVVQVLVTLKATINLYEDKASRTLVLSVLRQLAEAKGAVFVKATAVVMDAVVESMQAKTIVHPDAIPTAVAPRFVVLSWINVALAARAELADDAPLEGDAAWRRLVELAARLLWGIVPARSNMRCTKQNSLANSARHDVWRTLRAHPRMIAPMIRLLAAERSEWAAALLGNVISVAARLGGDAKAAVEAAKPAITVFIDAVLIGAKAPVSFSSVSDLSDFVRVFVGSEFEAAFGASIARMLLRSPEAVLPTSLGLLQALGGGAQTPAVAAISRSVFADQLASNLLRSTNASVRSAAAELFAFLAESPASAKDAEAAAAVATAALVGGRFTQPEHRVALYALLGAVRGGPGNGWASAAALVAPLLRMAAKETLELPVAALMAALGRLFGVLVAHLAAGPGEGQDESAAAVALLADAARKGLALPDRQAPLRLAWAAEAVGEPLWQAGATALAALPQGVHEASIAPLLAALAASAEKAAAAPLAGPTLDALVGVALLAAPGAAGDRLAALVTASDKPLVLWDKAFHRCTAPRECAWLLRAAQALFARGCRDARLAALLAWALSVRGAREPLRAAVAAMAAVDALALWQLAERALLDAMAGGAAPGGALAWGDVLTAVADGCGAAGADKERLLVAVALAAHHPACARPGLWIALAQRLRVDPRALCDAHAEQLLQAVQAGMRGAAAREFAAAEALARTLVLVGGERAARLVLQLARADVSPAALAAISADDVAVWRTAPGALHTDPLAAKDRAPAAPRNVRGQTSDDAWAAQVRRDLERKRSGGLSRDDQALVDAQLAAEATTRARVEATRCALVRALALVRAVVGGSAAAGAACMRDLVDVAGRAMAPRTADLAGAELLQALAAVAACAEGVEPPLRMPLATALLRARGLGGAVPAAWAQESLEDLATRVYFRLRVACEAAPLPAAGLCFVLPFMQATVDAGGWGRTIRRGVEEHDEYAQMDHAAEQLTMVVDLMRFHAHLAADASMPRTAVVELLVQLMAAHAQLLAPAADALRRVAEAMEGSDGAAERDALLRGLLQPDRAVRAACLAALDYADLTDRDYAPELWVCVGGEGSGAPQLEDSARAARALWAENGLEASSALVAAVVPLLASAAPEVRACAARAIALAMPAIAALGAEDAAAAVDAALDALLCAYRTWHVSLEPELDAFGLVVPGTQNRRDVAEAREAVAEALLHLAPHLATSAQVQRLVRFLVRERVLGERAEAVRARMLAAGARAVADHGGRWAGDLMPILERFLEEPDEGTAAYDCIREGVVVLLGRLAQHLPAGDDARVEAAVDRLVAALATPAESVQRAVSECLPPLAKRLGAARQAAVVEELLEARTLGGARYAVRRGGAYGLAGVVKGLGLAALKRFAVVDRLRAACEDKKEPLRRQGALFAFETMSAALGRLFEPYVIQFVPTLLVLFGDPSPDVRDAALDTARVIMASISGHGVKLVLPAALAGLADDQWRTKKGSVEILGAMAFCAPKQLSLALPAVVPRIVTVLADSHHQVAAAARAALLRFGDVIHNPEIQALVPTLLAALDDPAAKTDGALRSLLHTAFVHYIDAPSLALVVPILQRGMRQRAAATKRNAAQIMGAMATLTEPADLAPYLPELVPLVRGVLVDPVPEARATAAKALGSLVQRLGEERFPSLVADLIRVLKSDASGVDRAGAAQGLSEVLAGVGIGRLESLLPEIVANCTSARAPVREGFVLLLIFLPATFGDDFRPFLPQVVPPVLAALADEVELVRSAALRAGRILVASFAQGDGIEQLLPALLDAMHSAAWRIRHSAVELLGELLLRVAGISGKQAERDREAARALFFSKQNSEEEEAEVAELDEEDEEEESAIDDAAIASNLREILSQKLGADRCHAVLAALYVARSDISASVRQMSFTVWKSLVSNTPRTVRECLPKIMDIVLVGLASESYDRRTTAARTLGDLVHKLGEAVMSRVVPILERALAMPDETATSDAGGIRHGVFIGLSEILGSAGKIYIDIYADAMIPLVRRGLCDADPMVREAAASAFNALQQTAGPRVIDLIVPPLLNDLQDGGSPFALDALRELMAVRANVVFPVLIPTLTKVPVSAFNARALTALIQVAGASLSKRLPLILRALFDSMPAHHGDEAAAAALHETVRIIVAAAAQDEDTLDSLMLEFHECVKVPKSCVLAESPAVASRVAEACFGMEAMCQAFGAGSAGRGRSVLGPHVADWLRIFIDLMGTVGSPKVVQASWSALDALCKTVPKEDFDGYVGPVSRAVQHVTESLPAGQRTLPGFDLPKGLGPLLPIYAQGLLTGSPDTKERAVRGMARMVKFTDPSALRLFATGITGPLIRIVGDRHPATVKAAILSTLGLLLAQIPALMRPFLPQLQRTFVRGLTEADDIVRQRAAVALSALIPLQPRLDPLVSELTTGIRQTDDLGMKMAMIKAICALVRAPNASSSLSPASFQAIEDAVCRTADASAVVDSRWLTLRSQAFGALCAVLPEESAAVKLVAQYAVSAADDSAAEQAVKLAFLSSAISERPEIFTTAGGDILASVVASVERGLESSGDIDQGLAAIQAIQVAKNALLRDTLTPNGESPVARSLVAALIRTVDPQTMGSFDTDTQHAAMLALKTLAKHRFDIIRPVRDTIVLVAIAHVRDRVITVKLAAERCLLYALRLAKLSEEETGDVAGLEEFVRDVGEEKGRAVVDYHRRVLAKLADSTRELDYVSDVEAIDNTEE